MTKRISFSPTKSLESFIIRYQAKHNLGRPQEVIRDALLLLEEEELVDAYNQLARNETLKDNASSPANKPRNTCSVRVYRITR
jgi:PhoPQ-activated pathogenicity-related protein